MTRTRIGLTAWTLALFFCLIPFIGHGEVAALNEARVVAGNWLRLIVERDGNWGGTKSPSVSEVMEFKRGDLLLGYYVSAKPQGYVIISSLKDFSPIKAYSTTSNLDPDDESGMCALLKDVLERRLRVLIQEFGGLDAARLQGLRNRTPEANRSAWSYLLGGGSALRSKLQSLNIKGSGPVGPLLETTWNQKSPYNNLTPIGYGGSRTVVGCVATATAQIMRYYCWPPNGGVGIHHYDWDGDNSCSGGQTGGGILYADFSNPYDWVNMPNSNPSTAAQKAAVAELCYEVAVAVDMDFGCCSSGAYMADARDALDDFFLYCTSGNKPVLESRTDYSYDEWWYLIKNEIDHNRPMTYTIEGSGNFRHCIVVDGYDNSGGQYQVHANYGWNDAHSTWYTLDLFDCNTAAGWQGGCDPDKEVLMRFIYPWNGLFGAVSGTISNDQYVYVYGDITSSNLTAPAGACVQFLGGVKGTKITCSADSISIYSGASENTRFFSHGDLTKGVKLAGAELKLSPNGSIKVH